MIKENNFVYNINNIISEEENLEIKEYFKKQNKDNFKCFYPLSITNKFVQNVRNSFETYILELGEKRLMDFDLASYFYIQKIKDNNFHYNDYDSQNSLILDRIFNYILFLDPGEIKFFNLNHTESVLKNSLLIFPEEYTHNFELINSKNIVILNGYVNFN